MVMKTLNLKMPSDSRSKWIEEPDHVYFLDRWVTGKTEHKWVDWRPDTVFKKQ